jgi:hypothetical protein
MYSAFQRTMYLLDIQETVAVIITLITLIIIHDLVNSLAEKSNIKSIRARCLKPRAVFTHLEENMSNT